MCIRDSDRFAGQVLAFTLAVRDLWSSEELWWWVFSLPVMLFLYGLTFGAVHGRRTECISRREVCELQRSVRVLPRATVVTAAAVLCAVYALFLSLIHISARSPLRAMWTTSRTS